MDLPTPETQALGYRLAGLNDRMHKLRKMAALVRELQLTTQFADFTVHVDSLYAQAENEYLSLLAEKSSAPRACIYEVSVADAAKALQVAENTIRKWDVEGCSEDPSYPGRFSAIIFYQWAVTYQSKKRFLRAARQKAISNNNL